MTLLISYLIDYSIYIQLKNTSTEYMHETLYVKLIYTLKLT